MPCNHLVFHQGPDTEHEWNATGLAEGTHWWPNCGNEMCLSCQLSVLYFVTSAGENLAVAREEPECFFVMAEFLVVARFILLYVGNPHCKGSGIEACKLQIKSVQVEEKKNKTSMFHR